MASSSPPPSAPPPADGADLEAPAPPRHAGDLPSWRLTPRQRDDVDLLQAGAYAPLTGFLGPDATAAVVTHGQLPDGTPWPLPVHLEVDAPTAEAAHAADEVALTDDDGTLLALLTVRDVWRRHDGQPCLGGELTGVRSSGRWDFVAHRRPVLAGGVASEGPLLGALPTGPVDRRAAASWSRAADDLGADLVLLPPVGAEPERRRVARIRSYQRLLADLPDGTRLWLLPSHRAPDDPAVAALHAIVARNLGISHLLVAGDDRHRERFARLGIEVVDPERYVHPDDPAPGKLAPAVAAEIARGDPPRHERGLVVLFTGLSGSGKSTLAKVLRARLSEHGDRQVTLLDGDLVRQHLSSELGFSREHRDLNVRRIGFVASEIARHGGIAVCAPIAPYDATRRDLRTMAADTGAGFVLVHVATPLEVCEQRDVKGLYARARSGELRGFTGIDDPYEEPADAEVVVDTTTTALDAAAERIVDHLLAHGWLRRDGASR